MTLPPITSDTDSIVVVMTKKPPPKFKVCGKVQSAADSSPVTGASVVFGGLNLQTTSDAQGKFCIADVPQGDVTMIATKAGWEDTTMVLPGITADTDSILVVMSKKAPPPPPKVKVCGKVKSASDNTPVPGANVQVQGQTLAAVSDILGKFCITEVPQGNVILLASKTG